MPGAKLVCPLLHLFAGGDSKKSSIEYPFFFFVFNQARPLDDHMYLFYFKGKTGLVLERKTSG